jgi:hypothetical protein
MVETALTSWEVKDLVYTWFKKITEKAPVEDLLVMLSAGSLEMKFPEETLRNHTDFKKWLDKVTHLFFDQVHDVIFLDVVVDGRKADVNLIVNWQARTWTPPAAYSQWQGFYVHQHWVVVKDETSGRPVISTYQVGQFDPMTCPGGK